jgi:hypothetical protein
MRAALAETVESTIRLYIKSAEALTRENKRATKKTKEKQ